MSAEGQSKTPLFDAMVSLSERRKLSFHTPGHKSGKGISTRFRKFVGPNIFSIDLTTLDEVDSLHHPKGVIREAQTLAAEAYASDTSFFLINGTSGGNHAMVLAFCRPGSTVLVARNIHQSIVTGFIMSGTRPVFIDPEPSNQLDMTTNVSFMETKSVIDANPSAEILILCSPNYYGVAADLARIIPYAHDKGMMVLVDEAHGPHLHFHPDLPCAAMDAGADCSVQSTHKIIGGMTQASMLHTKGSKIDLSTLVSVLRQTQSTSPSYILMASLDLARMQMGTEGKKLLDKAISLAEYARLEINQIPGLFCFGKADFSKSEFDLDVTKLTISVERLGLTGFEVSKTLNEKYEIQVELAEIKHILVIVSIGDRREDLNCLVEALQSIADQQGLKNGDISYHHLERPPERKGADLTPREAFFKPKELIPLQAALGRLSSQIVTIYPPGIPLLIPGETITVQIIDFLKKSLKLGATISGLDEGQHLEVIKEESD